MLELNGKYNTAKVFTDNIEQTAISQIIELCNEESFKDTKIRIMPDVHAGKGCTIGTTITLNGKVVPNLVGVDIGCGTFCVKIANKNIDFNKLDNVIREHVPSGQNIRLKDHDYNKLVDLNSLNCKSNINIDRARKSIGTLGGGNHFIEVNEDSKGNIYLVIHSGSRYLGKQVAEIYQEKAIKYHKEQKVKKQDIINQLKQQGREKEIQKVLSELVTPKINESLAYLEGKDYDDYLHDMQIAQKYASLNREAIAEVIIKKMDFIKVESFTTIHNYIDKSSSFNEDGLKKDSEYILRKGAIRANKDEIVLIPINMRDGSIIAVGKGNNDWNYSAPHGAGRILSRGKAKELISLEKFKESMKNVFTTSVCESTIDESPMAYKSIEDILVNIGETVDVLDIIKPIYNYKAN